MNSWCFKLFWKIAWSHDQLLLESKYTACASGVSNVGLIEMCDKTYGIYIVVEENVVCVLVVIQNEYGILVITQDQDAAEIKC